MSKPCFALAALVGIAGAAGSARAQVDVPSYLKIHPFFTNASPWNTPIPPDAPHQPVDLSSYPIGLTNWGKGGGNIAIYYASASDPEAQVLYNADTWQKLAKGVWLAAGNTPAVEAEILARSSQTNPMTANPYSTAVPGKGWNTGGLPPAGTYTAWHQSQVLTVRIPTNAVPPRSTDGHTVIVQPDSTAIEMYAPVKLSSGQWVSEMYSVTQPVSGTGTGSDNGRTASMVPSYAGVLRDVDCENGSVPHALAIVVPHTVLKAACVSPALAFDSNNANYGGSLPMGAHLALPSDLNLNALGLSSPIGRMIAVAAKTYGLYVVDQGGGGISVVVQDRPTNRILAHGSPQAQADMKSIETHLVWLAK